MTEKAKTTVRIEFPSEAKTVLTVAQARALVRFWEADRKVPNKDRASRRWRYPDPRTIEKLADAGFMKADGWYYGPNWTLTDYGTCAAELAYKALTE